MLTRIKIFYWDALRSLLKEFLWGTVIREYMENGDTLIVENQHYSTGWHLILKDAFDNLIDIECIFFYEKSIKSQYADQYYVQDWPLQHASQETINELNRLATLTNAPVYVFDQGGIIGEWNIN